MAIELDPYWFPCDGPLLGVPHGANVLTNLPFLVVGGIGLVRLGRGGGRAGADGNRWGLWLSVALLAFGSGAYHLWLTPAALAADRICIAAIMTFVAAEVLAVATGGGPRPGVTLLLLAATEGSVLAWWLGATSWPYGILQIVGGLAIAGLALRGASSGRLPRTARRAVLAFVLLYGLGKAVEALDGPICEATGFGGHPVKHLFATAALAALLPWLGRRALQEAASGAP